MTAALGPNYCSYLHRIKLLFSTADIQNDPEEDFENENENENEDEENSEENADDEQILHTFPIRAALTVTKVCRLFLAL